MRHSALPQCSLHEQRGLTMVELMVAITLGLILTAGIIQIFVNSKQTYRVEAALSRVQENGRLALEFISNDIRMASYWGCQPSPANIVNELNPAGAGYINFTAGGIAGTEGGAGAADSITVRGAASLPGLALQPNGGGTTYSTAPATALQVNVPNDLIAGDIVLVSDCSGGDIFQITGANPSAAGVVAHAVVAGAPGNVAQFARTYQGDASIYYMRQFVYTIAPGSDGINALFRSVNGVNQEIVDDVTDLQILYGEDMDGDRSVDRYVTATGVANFANVYSVKMQVTVQTSEANTSVTAATRARQNFMSTVAIRNRAL